MHTCRRSDALRVSIHVADNGMYVHLDSASPYRRFIVDTSRRLTAKQLHRRLTVAPVFIRYTLIDSTRDFLKDDNILGSRMFARILCSRSGVICLEIHRLSETSRDNSIRISFVRQQDTSWKKKRIVITHTFPARRT